MLDEDQLDPFEKRGFVAVEGLIDQGSLDNVRGEYSALLDQLCGGWFEQGLVGPDPRGLSFWDKLTGCCGSDVDWFQPFDISLPLDGIGEDAPLHFGPAVFDLLTHPHPLDAVEQLIGPEITSNPIQHTRIKPPVSAAPGTETRDLIIETGWRQDMGAALEEADNSSDAMAENGCLKVSPGPRDRLLPHCDGTHFTLAGMCVADLDPVPAPVRSGGAAFLNPHTPHASLPNARGGFRRSFDLRHSVTGHPTGRSPFPDFVARPRSRPRTELRDWRKWRRSRRETRARMANEAHILQERWDNSGPCCA